MAAMGYTVETSTALFDPQWDAFLENTPGGDHLQSSAWAAVKQSVGWRPLRLLVHRDEAIVAGAQLLIRDAPLMGPIGCIAKGPVFARAEPELMRLVNDELQAAAREQSLQKLVLQPAVPYEGYDGLLEEVGFRPSTLRLIPSGTTRLDLSLSLDELLARMKSRTRYNIRRSERKGVVVREGTAADLETYYRLVLKTTNRKKFSPFPRRYYEEIWRVLHPRGQMHLLVAEVAGEDGAMDVASSLMMTTFGDSAENKLGVWSGRHGDKRPNDAIHWAAIKLAKSLGHRYYDMGGITLSAAEAALNGRPLPETVKQTVTSFKLDFGGEVVLSPGAFEFHPNPLTRWALGDVYPRLHNHRVVKRAFNWLRTRQPARRRTEARG